MRERPSGTEVSEHAPSVSGRAGRRTGAATGGSSGSLAPARTTLAGVKRWIARLAAATAGAVLCAGGVVPARAEDVRHLVQENCAAFPATPASELVNAWQLQRLGMESVWRLATGSGIRIAVIDTGVSTLGSPYLGDKDRFIVRDLIPTSAGQSDDGSIDCLHGTVVTSILAAGRASDGGALASATNFSGIAPDATVYAYRTLLASEQKEGQESEEDLRYTIDAVRQAIRDDVDVINLSQVTFGDALLPDFQEAIEDAIDAGIVVVAAAGNVGQAQQGRPYPAAFAGVIGVGVSNQQDAGDPTTYPSRDITVGAPGRSLVGLRPSKDGQQASLENQAYVTDATGTSYAAPVVTGIVALLLQYERDVHGRDLTPAEVKERLISTADRPAVPLPDPYLGYGIVNPMRALTNTTSGEAAAATPEATPEAEVLISSPAPTPLISMIALVFGIAAAIIVLLGVVAAIAIPAARRGR